MTMCEYSNDVYTYCGKRMHTVYRHSHHIEHGMRRRTQRSIYESILPYEQ
jgi:hypothetical protein